MLFGNGTKGNEFAHAGVSENNVDSPLGLETPRRDDQGRPIGDVALTPETLVPIAFTASSSSFCDGRYEDTQPLTKSFAVSNQSLLSRRWMTAVLPSSFLVIGLSPLLLS